MREITKEQVTALLDCGFENGSLTWKERPGNKTWNKRYAGREALTSLSMYGYKRGVVLGRHAFAHRIIWLLAHGEWPIEIDHINGVKTDNRLCDLRSVSRQQNMKNKCIPKDNKTGVQGLKLDKRTGNWVAAIGVNGRMKHLGVFKTFDEAKAARRKAEQVSGYHSNHGREAR